MMIDDKPYRQVGEPVPGKIVCVADHASNYVPEDIPLGIPDRLLDDAGPYYQRVSASLPSLPLALRVKGARRAAREGIFSSAALIDLYSQAYAGGGNEGSLGTDAAQLRAAYVDPDPAARVAAIRTLWGDDAQIPYDRQVLTAYAARDAELAREVIATDEKVDAFYNSIFRNLVSHMVENPSTISSAAQMLFVARNLERIGDHATNVAEMVHFAATGTYPLDEDG